MYVYLPLLYKHRFYVFMQADKMLVKNSENLLDAIAKMLSAAEATSVKVRFCAYNRQMAKVACTTKNIVQDYYGSFTLSETEKNNGTRKWVYRCGCNVVRIHCNYVIIRVGINKG